ncbi:hypothetical protein ACQPT2_18010 [Erwinia amylovora]
MNTSLTYLKQLRAMYQQERQPHKLFGLLYLTPKQRESILKEILYPIDDKKH